MHKFTISDQFFGRYQRLIKESVIPYQEKALNNLIEGAEKSNAVDNFKLAAEMLETGKCSGQFYGMVFQDSDVAKWLEACAYVLFLSPDEELMGRCDNLIELVGRAQHADGYLNTYFTVKEPGRRWTDLAEAHELYCAGHMIEAAVAYAMCTGKTQLLTIMCKMADHIYDVFITNRKKGYPGHPEIELALMRLYHYTQDERYFVLAKHFVDERGTDTYFDDENSRGWSVWGIITKNSEYDQSHIPVREQKKAVGHAVRAVYLYSGMADLASMGDESLKVTCENLWNNLTQRRMYLTGAVGSAYEGESFTEDYHLPNDTAYGETCAAIGLIFFARRMLELEQRGEYADVMEKALYNCVLAGMELDGTRFFYVNPLEALPGISGLAKTHHHTPPQRPKWFACACCPPNVARLVPSIAEYAWNIREDTVCSNLYISGTLDVSEQFGGKICVETGYPYEGTVKYRFCPNGESIVMTLGIRIPEWSHHTRILIDGNEIAVVPKDGYAYIRGPFHADSTVELILDMGVRRIYCNSAVSDNTGRAAIMRGPLVYCAEGVDHEGDVLSLRLAQFGSTTVGAYNKDKLMGICEITVEGYRIKPQQALYSDVPPGREPCTIHLIPYYTWANRGENQMRVWLPEI